MSFREDEIRQLQEQLRSTQRSQGRWVLGRDLPGLWLLLPALLMVAIIAFCTGLLPDERPAGQPPTPQPDTPMSSRSILGHLLGR
jgi:hypothetical protein